MNDLIAFLRARLDEDEAAARGTTTPLDWHQGPGDDPEWASAEMVLMWPPEFHTPYEQDKHWRGLTADPAGLATHIARHDPARALAETEAKRQLVEKAADADRYSRTTWATAGSVGTASAYRTMVRLLALPYADHQDYRDEWRP